MRHEVLQHARAHRAALADIERRRALVIEEIDARRIRNRVDRAALEVRRQRGLARDLACGDLEHLRAMLWRPAQELPQHAGIRPGAVARFALEAMALDQAVEIVAAPAGIEPARQAHGAERFRQVLEAGALELAPQEAVVEARVVRDEHAAGEPLVELARDLARSAARARPSPA